MMKKEKSSLILISMDLMAGLPRLQEIVSQLQELGEVQGISSIYRKFFNRRAEDLNSNLILAVRLCTELSIEKIFSSVQKIESQLQKNYPGQLVLLADAQEVRLIPGQNLPHPDLQTDALTIQCAAEAWPDFRHPILQKTLLELAKTREPLPQVEFFAQGKSLISAELI
jgi:7,8-dihydro-6-hydroxymethylpterin-pyrophosphokinase